MREAFRWSVVRRVTRTAAVSLAGNRYAVDPALVGRRVELRFDPEDLTRLDVYWEGRPVGAAVPFIVGRHVHRQVPPAEPPAPAPATGRRLPRPGAGRPRRADPGPDRLPRPARRRLDGGAAMTRAPWVGHFGFTHTPFGKAIPATQLCDRASHQEAVARIRFCVAESLLGVLTGEVGVGKTVAAARRRRPARPEQPPRHLRRQPHLRRPRPLRHHRPGPGRRPRASTRPS